MPYAIDMLAYFGKQIPDDSQIKYKKRKTVSVLAIRTGVEKKEGVPPEKYADEVVKEHGQTRWCDSAKGGGALNLLNFPTDILSLSERIMQRAEEVARKSLFSPELVLNLNGMTFDDGELKLGVNYTNYGSVVAARAIVPPDFTEDESLSVIDHIAPIGTNSVMLSQDDQMAIVGKRGKVLVGGKWMGYPAGIVDWKSDLRNTEANEALEEVWMQLYRDSTSIFLAGVARGRHHATNPNFNYAIYTDMGFKRIWEGTKRAKVFRGQEHDYMMAIPLDEEAYKDFVLDTLFGATAEGKVFDRHVDVGLAALLQVGRLHFGEEWYKGFTSTLTAKPYNVRIENKNFFA